MRVLPFKLAPLVLAVLAPFAQAQIITVGPNINVSKLAGNQSETAIAINRLNTNNITIGSNNIGGPLLFNKYTNDGGSTWTDSTFRPNGGYDPWMGADAFGALYYSYETVASGRATFIARSTDGGATYTTTQIPGTNADHPEMSIGPGAAPGTQSLYLRDSQGNNNRVISGTLTAGGAGPYAVQSSVGTGNFGSTAVGPGGRTIMTSMNPAGSVGPATMTLRYDADGTGPGGYVVQSNIVTNVGGFRPVPAQPSRTIDAQVELEYDFSGGANNGSLYMLYTQAANTTTNNTDIVFRKSTDNGLTFSPEIKLNTDAGTNSQFFGRMAVDQKTGWLASVWYDARNSATNNKVELWGTVSTDGGTTWAPNFKVSSGMTSCLSATIGGDGNECGDYISMDFYDGKIVTAWADSSNSTGDNPNGTSGLEIYFASIAVTAAVPEPGTYALFALGLLGIGLRARRRS